MKTLYSRISSFCRIVGFISRAALFALMLLITVDVIAGAVWQRFLWQQEITRWLMVILIFFALPTVQLVGLHPKVELLVGRFSPSKQRFIGVFGYLIIFVICGALIYFSVGGAVRAWQMRLTTEILLIPLGYIYFFIPLGIFMMGLVTLVQFLHSIKEDHPKKGDN